MRNPDALTTPILLGGFEGDRGGKLCYDALKCQAMGNSYLFNINYFYELNINPRIVEAQLTLIDVQIYI